MPKFKAVIFDMGGTLIDYGSPKQFMEILKSNEFRNLADISEKYQSDLFHGVRRKRKECRITLEEFEIMEVIESVLENNCYRKNWVERRTIMTVLYRLYTKGLKPFPEALEVLKYLKKKKITIGLVSNTSLPSYYHVNDLTRFGMHEMFSFLIFSSDLGYRKDHPFIYQRAVEQVNCFPHEILFVGDMLDKDVLGPKREGMEAALITRSGINENHKEIHQITDLWQIKFLIRGKITRHKCHHAC